MTSPVLIYISGALLISSITFAQRRAELPQCQGPFAACQAAGYKVGAHKKGDKEGADTGLWVDCIFAVADGRKQVPGVDRAAASACKAVAKGHK